MGKETGISWTDATFNPWVGCTKVSPGCDHCYAEAQDHRWGHDRWGKGKPRQMTSDSNWKKPLQWNAEARLKGEDFKVFCGSLCDVMDDEAPQGGRERLWDLIDSTGNLTWLLLTKRPHRYVRYMPEAIPDYWRGRVWLGTTAENQLYYDSRWPHLREAGEEYGLTTFISYEPAIGPLTVMGHEPKPDWLIFGGETGAVRRPMEEQWARDIKAECEANDIAFWMKQMSAQTPAKASALIPADMLVRQFPEVSHA